jgi:hypothetical protein
MAKGKILKTSAKKRGRKGKGRKAIPAEIKTKAKAAGFTSVKKWEEAGKPGPKTKQTRGSARKKDTEYDKKSKRGREITRLKKQQAADDFDAPGIGNRSKTYLNDPSDVGEGVNTMPTSRHSLPTKPSRAKRRRLIETGQAAPTKAGRTKKNPSGLRNTGRFAEPTSNVAEAMGLRGRGTIDEDEIMELVKQGGFEIRRSGGQIKYKKKGGPIGVGAARSGFGKVRN